jgi:plasmid stabilization system protein ParE
MAYRVKIMPRAKRDLEGIYSRIEVQSSDSARAWYAGLKDGIRRLRDNPNRCPVTTEDVRLRHFLYGNKLHIYRVIYRVVEKHKEVDVIHIRHGAQQEFNARDLN